MRRLAGLAGALALTCLAFAGTADAAVKTVVSCPAGNTTGDSLYGFYVQPFQGYTLGTVTVPLVKTGAGDPAGDYAVTLTARSGSYDGPLVGTVTSHLMDPGVSPDYTEVGFTFNAPVTYGSTVTFAFSGADSTLLYYDYAGTCPGVIQTDDTNPPLGSGNRGNPPSVTITGEDSPLLALPPLQPGPTGKRAAALKKCKRKKSAKARRKCRKKANKLPI